MTLKNYLRAQGYDLIDGPVRNHKPLQLWVKKNFNTIDFYYAHIDHAFSSPVALNEITQKALDINAKHKDSYAFSIGITLLEDLLESLGLGTFELAANFKSGKHISISYDNSMTKEIPTGEIENYLANADFTHYNPALLKNANRDNIIIITGAVYAKNVIVDIETDHSLNADLVANLAQMADGKMDFSITNDKSLNMRSKGNSYFPIAVKASRLEFDKGSFEGMTLVTDNKTYF